MAGVNQKNPSPWIPISLFVVGTLKFTANWTQTGQHTSTDLESLQCCWNRNRSLFLPALVTSLSTTDAPARPNSSPTYGYGATWSGAAWLLSPDGRGEVANLSKPSQGLQRDPEVQLHHLRATTSSARSADGKPRLGQRRSIDSGSGVADSVQLAETLVCFPCQWSTLQ